MKENYINKTEGIIDFLLIKIIDYNKYISEDKCEPHDSSCVHINPKTQKIIFVDNAAKTSRDI